ncbi:hypothetical protein ACSAZK_05115 [Methanosarcina sp. Mfa9]|uniref:hypothetical protein n=1 Tax=Methanosarcina sp. Mfa9 TaxID=3439063 RepID=UPI003F836C2C
MEFNYSKVSFHSFVHEIRFIIIFYIIGDWASTWYAMPYGEEFNPLPALILEHYGIFSLLVLKIILVFGLFFIFPIIKLFPAKWIFTKHVIEFLGILATVNNIMVVWYGNSFIQAMGWF